jgi:hypothetical protein
MSELIWEKDTKIIEKDIRLVDYYLMDPVYMRLFAVECAAWHGYLAGHFGDASEQCILKHLTRLEKHKWTPSSFDELVARIAGASGQDIWSQNTKVGNNKVAFQAVGKFRGHVFHLYDCLADHMIHIGAAHLPHPHPSRSDTQQEIDLWLDDLKQELTKQLATAQVFPPTSSSSSSSSSLKPVNGNVTAASSDGKFSPSSDGKCTIMAASAAADDQKHKTRSRSRHTKMKHVAIPNNLRNKRKTTNSDVTNLDVVEAATPLRRSVRRRTTTTATAIV